MKCMRFVVLLFSLLWLFGCTERSKEVGDQASKPDRLQRQPGPTALGNTTSAPVAAQVEEGANAIEQVAPTSEAKQPQPCVENTWRHSREVVLSGFKGQEREEALAAMNRFSKSSPKHVLVSKPDLDGDSKRERVYYWNPLSSNSFGWNVLYLSHNGCWRFGGKFYSPAESGDSLKVHKDVVHGMPVLSSYSREGRDHPLTWYHWSPNQASYQKHSEVNCLEDWKKMSTQDMKQCIKGGLLSHNEIKVSECLGGEKAPSRSLLEKCLNAQRDK